MRRRLALRAKMAVCPALRGVNSKNAVMLLRRSYMEILNPGNPWRSSVSRSQFEQMTLDAQERYKFAERERASRAKP
jgi:hypothetical protein